MELFNGTTFQHDARPGGDTRRRRADFSNRRGAAPFSRERTRQPCVVRRRAQ